MLTYGLVQCHHIPDRLWQSVLPRAVEEQGDPHHKFFQARAGSQSYCFALIDGSHSSLQGTASPRLKPGTGRAASSWKVQAHAGSSLLGTAASLSCSGWLPQQNRASPTGNFTFIQVGSNNTSAHYTDSLDLRLNQVFETPVLPGSTSHGVGRLLLRLLHKGCIPVSHSPKPSRGVWTVGIWTTVERQSRARDSSRAPWGTRPQGEVSKEGRESTSAKIGWEETSPPHMGRFFCYTTRMVLLWKNPWPHRQQLDLQALPVLRAGISYLRPSICWAGEAVLPAWFPQARLWGLVCQGRREALHPSSPLCC